MASDTITLTADDGHSFACYRSLPVGAPKGAVLVIQEIFGVNRHIMAVADGFARDGYAAFAPHLFDRSQRGLTLGYSKDEFPRGIEVAYGIAWDTVLKDVKATVAAARAHGKVGMVGYCWGGSICWVAATRLAPPDGPDAIASYYGSSVIKFVDEQPKVPIEFHFGERDASIPMDSVAAIQAAHPSLPVFVYAADHGFNCDERPAFDEAAANLARDRTLALFGRVVG